MLCDNRALHSSTICCVYNRKRACATRKQQRKRERNKPNEKFSSHCCSSLISASAAPYTGPGNFAIKQVGNCGIYYKKPPCNVTMLKEVRPSRFTPLPPTFTVALPFASCFSPRSVHSRFSGQPARPFFSLHSHLPTSLHDRFCFSFILNPTRRCHL